MLTKYLLMIAAALTFAGLVEEQPARATAPKYAIEITGAKHVVGVWKTRVYTTNFPAAEWMIAFPVASDLPRQIGSKTSMTPEGEMLQEFSPAKRPYVSLRVGPVEGTTPQSVSLAVRYEATLLARKLVRVREDATVAHVPPLDIREKALYTPSTPTLDFREEAFQTWLEKNKLHRQQGEDAVDFGRRVFTTMLAAYRFKDGVRINPASKLCDLAELDCDTLSVVFVSAMRANQIPARVLFTWPARTIKPDAKGIISGHAQAEFFADGVGWVPVDLAFALTTRRMEPARFFGEDDGTHLVAQVNPDYVIRSITGRYRVDSMHPGPDVGTRGAPKKADVRFQPEVWEVTVKDAPIPR